MANRSADRDNEITRGTSNVFADLGYPDSTERQAPAAARPRPQPRARPTDAHPGRGGKTPWCVAAKGVGPAELQARRVLGRTADDIPDRARPGRADRNPSEAPLTALGADQRGSGVDVADQASRRSSQRLDLASHQSNWFPLATMRLTILRLPAQSDAPAREASAGRAHSTRPYPALTISFARSWQATVTSNALSEGVDYRVEGHPAPRDSTGCGQFSAAPQNRIDSNRLVRGRPRPDLALRLTEPSGRGFPSTPRLIHRPKPSAPLVRCWRST